MTARTSSPDRFGHYLGGTLRRNLANMAFLFAVGFLVLPLRYFSTAFRDVASGTHYLYLPGNTGLYTVGSLVMTSFLWMLAALIFGFIGTGRMQNRRAVDLYHSLPLTRAQLLMGNFLGSFLTVTVPMTVNYIITMAAAGIRTAIAPITTAFSLGNSLMELIGWWITVFAVQAVIWLIATQVGSVFDTVIYSAVFLAAPTVLYCAHTAACRLYLPGAAAEVDLATAAILSPALVMPLGRELEGTLMHEVQPLGLGSPYLAAILVWLALGALILIAAMAAYKRRPSERAETTGLGGAAGSLFRALVVFLGSLFLGELLSLSFHDWVPAPLPLLLLCIAATGILLLFLMEAVLNRGFKGMKKGNLAVSGGVLILTLIYAVILMTGGLGFTERVPAAEKVESVRFSYGGRYEYVRLQEAQQHQNRNKGELWLGFAPAPGYTDPETIEAVTEFHRAAIHENEQKTPGEPYDGPYYGSVDIEYKLHSGGTLRRAYSLYESRELREAIKRLDDTAEFRQKTSPLELGLAERGIIESIAVGAPGSSEILSFSKPSELRELYEALRLDAAEESAAEYYSPDRETLLYLYINTGTPAEPGLTAEDFNLPVSPEYGRTLRWLAAHGADLPLPQADWDRGLLDLYAENNMWQAGITPLPVWYGEVEYYSLENGYYTVLPRDVTGQLLEKARTTYQPGAAALYLGTDEEGVVAVTLPLYVPPEVLDEVLSAAGLGLDGFPVEPRWRNDAVPCIEPAAAEMTGLTVPG